MPLNPLSARVPSAIGAIDLRVKAYDAEANSATYAITITVLDQDGRQHEVISATLADEKSVGPFLVGSSKDGNVYVVTAEKTGVYLVKDSVLDDVKRELGDILNKTLPEPEDLLKPKEEPEQEAAPAEEPSK